MMPTYPMDIAAIIVLILFIIMAIDTVQGLRGKQTNLCKYGIKVFIEKLAKKLYYCIKLPMNLRFFKIEDLYVSKHEILNDVKAKDLCYKDLEEYGYSVYKRRIKSIGLYEKIVAPVMEKNSFLKNVKDGHFIKCDNLEESIKSLTGIKKFNL